jgi:heme/copper-type cytochrome/quinol oxidase subunit 2
MVFRDLMVICISSPVNHPLTYREVNCRRGKMTKNYIEDFHENIFLLILLFFIIMLLLISYAIFE